MKRKLGKICVVFTGGTIGSKSYGNVVDLSTESGSLLINKYRERFGAAVEFEELHPLNLLSENVQPSDLLLMADCVNKIDKSAYDGIIITHGTDTLCFTANLFSQWFCDSEIPIVFVSALYPLDDDRSRGVENFAGAITFIQSVDYGGVFVSFENQGENCKIHLASRILSATQFSGEYESLLNVHFGEVKGYRFIRNPDKLNPTEEMLKRPRSKGVAKILCTDLVTIQAHALLNFDYYRFEKALPKAVMVQLYHSGTVCTKGTQANFKNFLSFCEKRNVQVVIAPINSRARVYESALGLTDMCSVAYDISFEMATVKVLLALGSGLNIQEELNKNLFFEKLYC